ncbi:MAG: DNA-3-methyladenine glycosylase family protein [Candidatus Coproplasma sp.]
MDTISYESKYFNPADTLDCGQIFRYESYLKGYKVFSGDKACYVYTEGDTTFIESEDSEYFSNYFDLGRDYGAIIAKMESFDVPVLTKAARSAKGLRLLNQNPEEMIFSFIISQNNNIPRIKKIINAICRELGEEREFMGERYFTFPTAKKMAERDADFYKSSGAGYRDKFLSETACRIALEGIEHLKNLPSDSLRRELLTYKGIGGKVADCVSLFGFGKRDSFPVDTWIEKLYREDFGGTLTDRDKITDYFKNLFGEYSGYVQQYLFYYKRQQL